MVPQGLSLEPLLFSLFVAPLGDVILRFGLLYHQYANDTHLYITRSSSTNLAACTTAIYEWLLHNCLALNSDKSESAIFGTVTRTKSPRNVVSINVAGMPISLSHCVKSLGVIFDKNLKFDAHVSAAYKGRFFHIRTLHHLSMFTETAKMIACAIVSSRLDYCNSVLAGMSDANFNKLESVQ